MSKTTLFLFVLSRVWCKAQPKGEILFNAQYKPLSKYSSTIDEKTKIHCKYLGSYEFLKALKEKDVKNPYIMNTKSETVAITTTGKQVDSVTFPLTLEYVKTSTKAGKKQPADRYLVYGHCVVGNMPTFDSVGSVGQTEEFKKSFIKAAQSILSQASFPEKRVKIGDTFSTETPISIPTAGLSLDMSINTLYKLSKIYKGIACFDVLQNYTMKSTSTDCNMDGTGTGAGKLLYDISNNYNCKYAMNIEMVLKAKWSNYDFDERTKFESVQITKMSK